MRPEELKIGQKVFFRMRRNRKPYQVIVVSDPDEVNNVKVRFTNGGEEWVRSAFLYPTWDEAAGIAPIRPPRVEEKERWGSL